MDTLFLLLFVFVCVCGHHFVTVVEDARTNRIKRLFFYFFIFVAYYIIAIYKGSCVTGSSWLRNNEKRWRIPTIFLASSISRIDFGSCRWSKGKKGFNAHNWSKGRWREFHHRRPFHYFIKSVYAQYKHWAANPLQVGKEKRLLKVVKRDLEQILTERGKKRGGKWHLDQIEFDHRSSWYVTLFERRLGHAIYARGKVSVVSLFFYINSPALNILARITAECLAIFPA